MKTVPLLCKTGEYLFDLSKNWAQLNTVTFRFWSCTKYESKIHSFTGESAGGRWDIDQHIKYLWISYFYWVRNCAVIKEILEYDGSITMVRWWAHDILSYHFTVFHRSTK